MYDDHILVHKGKGYALTATATYTSVHLLCTVSISIHNTTFYVALIQRFYIIVEARYQCIIGFAIGLP